jgi:cyclase
MLAKRIIPCLDCTLMRGKPQVVKGTKFKQLKYAGVPWELARRYYEEGADELVFLDISASKQGRKTMLDVVRKTTENVFIPVCVGGGISSVDDFRRMLNAGADKCAINTAAVINPALIREAANVFGSNCVVVSIDAKRTGDKYEVLIYGGTRRTGMDAVEWAKRAAYLGAGEILLTSMDADGTKEGYDLELLRQVCASVSVPVIASGGAGSPQDMLNVLQKTDASAVLAASIFHYGKYSVKQVKKYLEKRGVDVRL